MGQDYKDRIFLATFSENAPKTAFKYGYGVEINDLCVSNWMNEDLLERTIRSITREISHGYGITPEEAAAGRCPRKVIMHGPFTELTPCAMDDLVIEHMRFRYRQAVEICQRFGIRDLVLHSGFIPLMYHKSWHLERSVKFWQSFSEELPEGFIVYVENVFEDEPYLLRDVVKETDRPNIRACLDVGHANAMGSAELPPEEWVRVLAPYLGHFHIHNNDGHDDQHRDVDDGTMDMKKVLDTIGECCAPEVTLTVESRRSEPSAAYLKKYFEG